MASQATIDRRKREGKCVRCELPHIEGSQYCEAHREQQRAQNKRSQQTRLARRRQLADAYYRQSGECAVCSDVLEGPNDSDEYGQGLFQLNPSDGMGPGELLLCSDCSRVVRVAHRRKNALALHRLANTRVKELIRES